MVQILSSAKVQEKLKQELSKYQIDVVDDSKLVLVERGYDIPGEKLVVVFDAIDYLDAVNLLVASARKSVHYPNTVTGFRDNKFTVIENKEIVYIEAGPDGITAHTGASHYSMKETLQYYESIWEDKGFIRVNKSQLVNLLHVQEIIPWFNSRYVMKMDNGAELEVSKMYSKQLRRTLKI